MKKAFDLIEKYQMIKAKDKVIVGVSGGADSLCLLFVLLDYRCRVPFSIEAVHVEHGIRGQESLEDARFVEELCASLRVECRTVSVRVPEIALRQKLSVEEAARRVRYETFDRICRETGADKIAVAHNRDDQAETILFQMARGSGLDGACGIRPVRGNIIRPLLDCSRAEIEEELRRRGISWRTDSTNGNMEYTRNRLRHTVLPALKNGVNSAAGAHIAAFGKDLQKAHDYLIKAAWESVGRSVEFGAGSARIDVEKFLREDETLRPYCLRECLERAGCGMKNISRVHIEGIQGLFFAQSGRRQQLPGGWQAERQFGEVIIGRRETARENTELPPKDGAVPVQITGAGAYRFAENRFYVDIFPYKNENILKKTYTKWFDYDKINNNLFLRTRQAGDYLVIAGGGQKKKLKQYLIGEKIPQAERDRIPLLACGNEILWVVGHRISAAYKVTPETKHVLEIRKMGGYDDGRSEGTDIRGKNSKTDRGDGPADQ